MVEASQDVPIEVRAVEVTPAGVLATLVNRAAHAIVEFEISVLTVDADGTAHGHSSSRHSGNRWQPGVELVTLLPRVGSAEGVRVVPLTALLENGAAFGKPETITRIRRDARSRRDGLTGLLDAIGDSPTIQTEEDLQALIDRRRPGHGARAWRTADGTCEPEPHVHGHDCHARSACRGAR